MARVDEQLLAEIDGSGEVVTWFGYWPSFHDAEVISVLLDRQGESKLRIHAFTIRRQLNEKGQYKTTEHALVTFVFTNILAMDLADFNNQNVISGLVISKKDIGYQIELGCCYGLCGHLQAESIRLEIEPGMPAANVYQ